MISRAQLRVPRKRAPRKDEKGAVRFEVGFRPGAEEDICSGLVVVSLRAALSPGHRVQLFVRTRTAVYLEWTVIQLMVTWDVCKVRYRRSRGERIELCIQMVGS